MNKTSYRFSGHESFHCRPFWLKKGYDFVKAKKPFNDKAGIELGVGRNMVGSIKFWLKAFDLVDKNDSLTQFAEFIFKDNGWDPFLEDEATLWLLHYKLCAKNYSTIYNLIFSELRKIKPEFSKEHFIKLVNEIDSKQSTNIVGKDFTVFLRTYLSKNLKDIEESYSGLLTELELINEVGEDNQKNTLYHVSNRKQDSIPWEAVLYCILENKEYSDSISIKSLILDKEGVGSIFAFSQDGLEAKLIEIADSSDNIVYKNDAGIKELQFKGKKPIALEILKGYYEKQL